MVEVKDSHFWPNLPDAAIDQQKISKRSAKVTTSLRGAFASFLHTISAQFGHTLEVSRVNRKKVFKKQICVIILEEFEVQIS